MDTGDVIAKAVLDNFNTWERKRKPLDRSAQKDGKSHEKERPREWVPLSGIVAQKNDKITCIASATGMKCLSRDKVPKAQGIVVHDWHAEILAIRSLNRFLLEECLDLAMSRKAFSEYVRFRGPEERTKTHFQPFALQDDISLHMYCSEAPCGDASMEITIAAQEDSTPWQEPSPLPKTNTDMPALHGRGYFSALGAVRRKPSRPDAPPTLSKSCSDKISAKQATSLLSSIASLLISPQNCYIQSLTLPEPQYSQVACTRAFSSSGRLAPLDGRNWGDGYSFKPFTIHTTSREFIHSRRQPLGPREVLVPSNIASLWTPRTSETIIGGTQQGRKQFSIKGASSVCKRRTWLLAVSIADALCSSSPAILRSLKVDRYAEVKSGDLLRKRKEVKNNVRDTLKGWQRNDDAEEWACSGVEA
ncbi:related to tRNA-specific adenosine deaminase 1 [Phialocephala subalpina]|uniref:Related to tRNA-specific adenosine deaminase 1 n=1 Tax=Phialocephala subalpina TaxID=576137 RepID=A0A1L7WFU5_9HELO|nr:related to tRNA-specific adenosine deaminase 1 [Phialocephala subalpina]